MRAVAALFERARRLFASFHGFEPSRKGDLAAFDMKKPEVSLLVGEVLYIGYIDLSGEKYMHKFTRHRPLLYASSDGRQLYIGKGRYRFTERGIT